MRTLVALAVVAMLGACSLNRPADSGYEAAVALWTSAKAKPEYGPYADAFIDAQNAQRLDDNSGCYAKGVGTTVVLILEVGSSGRIDAAYSDGDSAKARCFRAAYLGAQMPIPPFFPFPMRMMMG